MEPFPKFSIIIPFHNSAQHLETCITSIFNQKYTNYEIILIDDGSTDDSLAVVQKLIYRHHHVKVIHQENRGVSAARNTGIHEAKGDWLIFMDSDDYVRSGYLECFDELSKESNVNLLSQGYYSDDYPGIGKKDVYLNDRIVETNEIFSFVQELKKIDLLGYLWCKSFKKEIIDHQHLYFNEQYRFMEDSEFVLRFLKYADKIVNSHKCLYHYTFNLSGKSYGSQNTFELNISRYLSLCEIKNTDQDIPLIVGHLLDEFLIAFIDSFFCYDTYQKIKYSRFIEEYLYDYFYLSKSKRLKMKLFLFICRCKKWRVILINGFIVSCVRRLTKD